MKKIVGFEKGMGIEGWLTNYKRFNSIPQERRLHLTIADFEHFAEYITEEYEHLWFLWYKLPSRVRRRNLYEYC